MATDMTLSTYLLRLMEEFLHHPTVWNGKILHHPDVRNGDGNSDGDELGLPTSSIYVHDA